MSFKYFPADITLVMVNEYIYLDDIVSFTSICHGIRDLAKSRSRKRRELKASHSTIDLEAYDIYQGKETWERDTSAVLTCGPVITPDAFMSSAPARIPHMPFMLVSKKDSPSLASFSDSLRRKKSVAGD